MRNLHATFSYERDIEPNVTGRRDRPVFQSSIAPNGAVILKETGKEDFQAYIESFALTCDMSYVLDQLRKGNSAVLSSSTGFFADISGIPDTYQGVLDMMASARNQFNQLPLDKRAEYDHDFNRFFADIGSPHFMNLFAQKDGDPVA